MKKLTKGELEDIHHRWQVAENKLTHQERRLQAIGELGEGGRLFREPAHNDVAALLDHIAALEAEAQP